jgi:threonine dehydratase
MRFAFERLKVVLEPSGAVGLAAVLAGRVAGNRIGVVLSGGNIDTDRFTRLIGGDQPSSK